MIHDQLPEDEPCYVISVAAKLVELHPQRLRYYERIGLVKPSRTSGRQRLYSRADIEKLRKIARLTVDLGVNLAGVEVILNMTERINELQAKLGDAEERYLNDTRLLQRRIQELERLIAQAQQLGVISVEIDSEQSGNRDQDQD